MAKLRLKNRTELVIMALQNPDQEMEFTARFLDEKAHYYTFSQLYLKATLMATHFNLPKSIVPKLEFNKGQLVKLIAQPYFYEKNGTKIGSLKAVRFLS